METDLLLEAQKAGIDVESLRSWPEYVWLRNWYSGGGFLQRFWRHTVCRLLAPHWHWEMVTKYRWVSLTIETEFRGAAAKLWLREASNMS